MTDLEIECVWYSPDDEAEILNEFQWRWRKDEREMKERKSAYSWASRVFTFVSARIFHFTPSVEEKLETSGQ